MEFTKKVVKYYELFSQDIEENEIEDECLAANYALNLLYNEITGDDGVGVLEFNYLINSLLVERLIKNSLNGEYDLLFQK